MKFIVQQAHISPCRTTQRWNHCTVCDQTETTCGLVQIWWQCRRIYSKPGNWQMQFCPVMLKTASGRERSDARLETWSSANTRNTGTVAYHTVFNNPPKREARSSTKHTSLQQHDWVRDTWCCLKGHTGDECRLLQWRWLGSRDCHPSTSGVGWQVDDSGDNEPETFPTITVRDALLQIKNIIGFALGASDAPLLEAALTV